MTAVLLDREDIPAAQLADALRTQTPDGQYRFLELVMIMEQWVGTYSLLTDCAAIWLAPLRQGLGLGKSMPVLHLQLLLRTPPDRCVKLSVGRVGKRSHPRSEFLYCLFSGGKC